MFARKILVIYASLKILCKTAECSPFREKLLRIFSASFSSTSGKTVCKICKGETFKLPKFRSLTTRSYGIPDSRSSTFAFHVLEMMMMMTVMVVTADGKTRFPIKFPFGQRYVRHRNCRRMAAFQNLIV